MEEMGRLSMGKGHRASAPSASGSLFRVPSHLCHPGGSLDAALLGALWKLHDLGMFDEIIGHWNMIQPPTSTLLPSTEVMSGTESSNP